MEGKIDEKKIDDELMKLENRQGMNVLCFIIGYLESTVRNKREIKSSEVLKVITEEMEKQNKINN